MVAILTRERVAAAVQNSVSNSSCDTAIEAMQGLITEVIGDRNPWPTIAWTIALNGCIRALGSPDGARQDTSDGSSVIFNHPLYEVGYYLTEGETEKLLEWKKKEDGGTGRPSVGTIRLGSGYPAMSPGCRTYGWPLS